MTEEVASAVAAEQTTQETTTEAAAPETASAEEKPSTSETTQGQEDSEKREGGYQRVKRQREEARAEAEFWRKRALERQQPEQKPEAPAEKARPKREDFRIEGTETYDADAYQEALIDWKADQKLSAYRKEQQQSEQARKTKTEAQEREAKWQDDEAKFAAANQDYEEVTDAAVEAMRKHLTEATQPTFELLKRALLESGPELLYQLGKHPEEIQKLAALSPARAVLELGNFAARLAGQEPAPVVEKATAPKTRTPKPATPTISSGAVDDGELRDDLPPKEWGRRFQQKMKRR